MLLLGVVSVMSRSSQCANVLFLAHSQLALSEAILSANIWLPLHHASARKAMSLQSVAPKELAGGVDLAVGG
jgi:hypothetical protein